MSKARGIDDSATGLGDTTPTIADHTAIRAGPSPTPPTIAIPTGGTM